MTSILADLKNPARPSEIAAALRVSRAVIYREIHEGRLPAVRVSVRGDVRVPREGLEAWMEAQTCVSR